MAGRRVRVAERFEHGDALANPTVGGCHPNDLGTADVASFWSKFLPTVLKD